MPIVGNGKDVRIEYEIPEDIKRKIPAHFYITLAEKLRDTFGSAIFEQDEYGTYGLSYVSGTAGWYTALEATCHKLDMRWLLGYYNSLAWYDSDLFDAEIENEILFGSLTNQT